MRFLKLAGVMTLFVMLSNEGAAKPLATPDFYQGGCPTQADELGDKVIEPSTVAWSVYFDNDLFTSSSGDRDLIKLSGWL